MAKSRIAQLLFKLGADNKALLSKLDQTDRRMKGFKRSMKSVGGLVAGAFAARQVINFTKEITNLAGQMQGVRQAFEKLNDPGLLQKLQVATRGTLSELELMQQAVKADNFRIPMDTFAKGLEFATKRAGQTGESIDYMVNSFTTGLGRESVKILDNLGISALELSEEVEKVGDFATAVGNIMDRELAEMGDVVLSTKQKMEKLNAQWTDFKIGLGEALVETGAFETALNKVAGALEKVLNIEGAGEGTKAALEIVGALSDRSKAEKVDFLKSQITATEQAVKDLTKAGNDLLLSGDITDWFAVAKFGKSDEAGEMAKKLHNVTAQLKIYKSELAKAKGLDDPYENEARAVPILQKLRDEITFLKDEKELLTEADRERFAVINDEIQALENQIKSYGKLTNVVRDNVEKISGKDAELFTPINLEPMFADVGPSIERNFKKYKELLNENALELSGLVEAAIEDTIFNIAENLGKLAAGGIGLEDLFANIIEGFGGFLKQMGAMLISYGVALAAFEYSGNPYVMIAAGAAMVAIGAAIGVLMSKRKGAMSGAASGSASGVGATSYQQTGFTQPSMSLQGTIKGEDIYITSQKYQSRIQRVNG